MFPFMYIYFKLKINDEVIYNDSDHKDWYGLSMFISFKGLCVDEIRERIIKEIYNIVQSRGWDIKNYDYEVSNILHIGKVSDWDNSIIYDKKNELFVDKFQYYSGYIFGGCIREGKLYI